MSNNRSISNDNPSKIEGLLHEVSQIDHYLSSKLHKYAKWLTFTVVECVSTENWSGSCLFQVLYSEGMFYLFWFVLLHYLSMSAWVYMLDYVGKSNSVFVKCSAMTVLFTEPLKYLFRRNRPQEDDINNRVVPLRRDVTNPAFPSGDSAQVSFINPYDSIGCCYRRGDLLHLWKLPSFFTAIAHYVC